MENYRKARTEERASACPFPDLPADTPQVTVKEGSKIRNLLRFALGRVEEPPSGPEQPPGVATGTPKASAAAAPTPVTPSSPGRDPPPPRPPPCRQIVFTATGKGVSKAITCAEVVKRRLGGALHQHTRLAYSAALEVWEPLEPDAGLDPLTVHRNVPSLWILLSRDPLDPRLPGYQAPGNFDALWAQALRDTPGAAPEGPRHGAKRGRGGGGGWRGGGRGVGGGGRGRGGGGRQMGRPRERGGPS